MADMWGGTTPTTPACSDSSFGSGFPPAKRQKKRQKRQKSRHHVQGTRSMPGSKPKRSPQDEVVAGVRRAMTETLPTWMKVLECETKSLFAIAVSLPHLLACVYWECQLQIDTFRSDGGKRKEDRESSIDRAKLYQPGDERNEAFGVPCQQVIKSLAVQLVPLFPNERPAVIGGVLEHTGLNLVLAGYLGLMVDAMLQNPPIYWTNDFGMEHRFDPEIHSEVGAAGRLLAGDRCRVIFPSAMVKGLPRSDRSETDEDRPLTKRYVLPVPPPMEMTEMLADAAMA